MLAPTPKHIKITLAKYNLSISISYQITYINKVQFLQPEAGSSQVVGKNVCFFYIGIF